METTTQTLLSHLLKRWGGDRFQFPFEAAEIEGIQTHISIVILAGSFAYKIKKPVQFPFVDYSTLEKRRHCCQMEVDLNRRLTDGLYLGVVPITRAGNSVEFEGQGEPVEYAVKMRRLPDDRRLGQLLLHEALPEGFWDKLAYRLARFHRDAARGPEVSRWAGAKEVEEDLREILRQLAVFSADILHPVLREKLQGLALHNLKQQKGRIEKRVPLAREGHGDLRLEHIYYFPEEPEPRDLALIDCVEFNPRYRCGDPLLDVAFLIMDLQAAGFTREAEQFKRAYQSARGEATDGLMDYYVAYRHLVRGLVRGLQSQEEDAAEDDLSRARARARLHFLKAYSLLEDPERRPCLVVLSGLPGTGKSSLARKLKDRECFRVFSSDTVRKELAGLPPDKSAAAAFEKGIYQADWTDRTYNLLLQKAESHLLQGGRAAVDASFWNQAQREDFKNLARRLGVPFLFFTCRMSEAMANQRLREKRLYASDADFEIYQRVAQRWEKFPAGWGDMPLDTEQTLEASLADIRFVLSGKNLSITENLWGKNTGLEIPDNPTRFIWKT